MKNGFPLEEGFSLRVLGMGFPGGGFSRSMKERTITCLMHMNESSGNSQVQVKSPSLVALT
jgi:hypothetical protein